MGQITTLAQKYAQTLDVTNYYIAIQPFITNYDLKFLMSKQRDELEKIGQDIETEKNIDTNVEKRRLEKWHIGKANFS